ncbi:hypothetical protein [Gordonia polyisoprenivorans]|uniref:hypothetical protein n=1 Tax=Gordonia polyisoprenivorans TaxID=84595 RepID=UPI0003742D97|nr:hypothetical protein [Gordonia polyisoprenivorans]
MIGFDFRECVGIVFGDVFGVSYRAPRHVEQITSLIGGLLSVGPFRQIFLNGDISILSQFRDLSFLGFDREHALILHRNSRTLRHRQMTPMVWRGTLALVAA